MPATPSIIIYDGDCMLCSRAVMYIIRHDPGARFRFLARGSEKARDMLSLSGTAFGRKEEAASYDSIVLLQEGRAYVLSDALLLILKRIKGKLGPFYWALLLCPRALRDLVYKWVAKHRHVFFGKSGKGACLSPLAFPEHFAH